MTAIEIKNLTHIYNAGSVFEKIALDNVNLKISSGEMVSIIGHTGSGKSTLIQHMNALLKPTSGQIFLYGENLHADKKKLKSIRQRVGLVFQYPEHQLFESTIYKDVAFGPTRMGLPEEKITERVHSSLQVVGIDESLYGKSPFEISGGQKRRVAIAGVLAMQPEVLVLDEPAAGLDPGGKNEILSQIRHMHTTLGITVILVSHSMDDVARLSHRIFVMNKGQLICEGTPAQVFSQLSLLKSVGLDVPQISQIFMELNKKNPHVPAGVFSVEDAVNILTSVYKGKNL
jgi:energy-coupling factor transport system ATP-binding protein